MAELNIIRGSLLAPSQPPLGYVTGKFYLACAPLMHTLSGNQATADRIFYIPPFQIVEDVTFTAAKMYVTGTAAGSARISIYTYSTNARISQLGNIDLSATGWRSLSISLSLTRGQAVFLGVNYSSTPTVARVLQQAGATDSAYNERLTTELGKPSFIGDPTDSNIWCTRAGKTTFTYDGSTTPDPAAPSAEDGHIPAVFLVK